MPYHAQERFQASCLRFYMRITKPLEGEVVNCPTTVSFYFDDVKIKSNIKAIILSDTALFPNLDLL